VAVAAEVAEVAACADDVALVEAALVEAAPVEAAPVEAAPVEPALVEVPPEPAEAAASPSWLGVASGGSAAASERVPRWRAVAGAAVLLVALERLEVL
jgi:hypothetical protein